MTFDLSKVAFELHLKGELLSFFFIMDAFKPIKEKIPE